LNWENITAPRFCILDMEHWCSAVTGYGAAALILRNLTRLPDPGGLAALLRDHTDTLLACPAHPSAIGDAHDPPAHRQPVSRRHVVVRPGHDGAGP
jgi:hypothetical protein